MARLLVFVPGIRLKASAWQPLIQQLEKDPAWTADSQILAWDHGTGILGRKPLLEISGRLAAAIGTRFALRAASGKPPFDDIVLIGHSMGALLVRQAYLIGLGSTLNNMSPQPWAPLVSRIVLLAGVNSGVSLSWWQKQMAALVLSRKGTVHDIMRGSDFITNLRLWWIRKLTTLDRRPIVIQLLGSRDNIVDREDSLDIEGFLEGHQFLVDGFDHLSLLIPGRGMNFDETQYETLSFAILRNVPNDTAPPATYNPHQKVFFVVHGIRDGNNDWVEDIAERLSATFPGARVITPDIGRFSALQFLTPSERNRYVRWFQGVYSQEFAKNPLASFNFVGHSYGTYLLGHGLRKLTGMRFDTAGYTGFRLAFAERSEWRFYKGGHDATIAERVRPHIIGFLSEGFDFPQPILEHENPGFTRASAAAKILLPLILVLWVLLIALSAFWPPLQYALRWALGSFVLFLVLLVGTTAFY